MSEKFQSENPNSHYLANLSNLNLTNNNIQLGRLPTLGEILSNKTKSPINLYNFYLYTKSVEYNADYLDFWFDLINHLNLCKHYVKGLRESIVRQSAQSGSSGFATNNPFGNVDNRDSYPLSERSKHKSLSSSMLLDLIINDHILEDNDSNRLSQFLRGDINLDTVDPKLKEMIEHYGADKSMVPPSPIADSGSHRSFEKRLSSNSRLMDEYHDSSANDNTFPIQQPSARGSKAHKYSSLRQSLNPTFVEQLIGDSNVTNQLISRATLKESSHNLLLKYFVEDSEKTLDIPPKLNDYVVKAIEVDGRDDPDVFNSVKRFVFSKLENEYLPDFLNFVAIKNVNASANSRVIVGFIFIFFSFWIAFSLIFLNEKKRYRCVVIFTFFVGFYCLLSSVYRLDPFLALIRRSEFDVVGFRLIRVDDSFIHRLLLKRAAWVMFLIVLATAALSVLFCLAELCSGEKCLSSVQESFSLLLNSLLSSLSGSSVLGSSSLSLLLQGLLTSSLSLGLDDVLNQSSLVLEGVTLSSQVQVVVQGLVDLAGLSVLSQQSSQDSQSSHPDNLGWHTGVLGTLSLTVTHVSTVSLGLSVSSGTGSRVDGSWLLDDGTVLVQLSDGLTRVGRGQLGGLVRVQPDLSLTDTNDASGESLLSSKISPVEVSNCAWIICFTGSWWVGCVRFSGLRFHSRDDHF